MGNNKNNKINAALKITNLNELDAAIFLTIPKLKEKMEDNTNYYLKIEVYKELQEYKRNN